MSLLQISANNEKHMLIAELVTKTNVKNPSKDDLRALRDLLRQCPEVWREGQTLTDLVTETCISSFYTDQPAFKEIVTVKVEAIKQDLDWQNACPLERLLIGNVVLSYMRWMVMGSAFDRKLSIGHIAENGLYWSKQLVSANKNYLKSIEVLTKFRKLARSTPSLRQDLISDEVM